MVLVGLTGSMATGKSTVSKILKDLGAVIIDADLLARQAVARGSEGLARIERRFGPGVLTAEGDLDRAAMRRLIFSDPQAKKDLEAIIHPAVLLEEQRLISEAEVRNPRAVVVVDMPLLYEIDQADRFDRVIVVYAPRDIQIERLCNRDGCQAVDADSALRSQMDIEDKRRRADIVIDNQGSLEETRRQVKAVYKELKSLAEQPLLF